MACFRESMRCVRCCPRKLGCHASRAAVLNSVDGWLFHLCAWHACPWWTELPSGALAGAGIYHQEGDNIKRLL